MSLRCPICKATLSLNGKMYQCENNHSYDIAKEGYVNLLPVQKKNSKNPGDSKEMINARRAFLEGGHYDLLVKVLIEAMQKIEATTLLDAGCGEGYYSAKIASVLSDINVLAFDISKDAIKKAAKKYKSNQYFIASTNDIPVNDNSVDIYLTIFAPLDVNEINRVLNDNGKAIIVSAGPNHMREIAEEIYDTYIPHNYDPSEVLSTQLQLESKKECTFELNLESKEHTKSMLQMTPYYWSAGKIIIDKLLSKNLTVTCDFQIQVFMKK